MGRKHGRCLLKGVALRPVCALQALLTTGMSELLATAADGSICESWPRVHAFNCLHLAFNDKILGIDTSGFFAQGFLPESMCFQYSCFSRSCEGVLPVPVWPIVKLAMTHSAACMPRHSERPLKCTGRVRKRLTT